MYEFVLVGIEQYLVGRGSELYLQLLAATRQQTQTLLGGLLNLERLRPYFDVQPRDFLKRYAKPLNAHCIRGGSRGRPTGSGSLLCRTSHRASCSSRSCTDRW